jgi:hypothetical protein
LFIVRNGRLNAEWQTVEPSILKIGQRSISSLIKYQGRGDLDRIYFQCRNSNVDFNLASIPPSFTLMEKEPLERSYMSALFDVKNELARNNYSWQKRPPDF